MRCLKKIARNAVEMVIMCLEKLSLFLRTTAVGPMATIFPEPIQVKAEYTPMKDTSVRQPRKTTYEDNRQRRNDWLGRHLKIIETLLNTFLL